MSDDKDDPHQRLSDEADQADIGLIQEFWLFLSENKKWWMIPLIGALMLIGLVSLIAASGAAPFIYTIF